jgi:hypothetical protein
MLSDEHLRCFGSIVNLYANAEDFLKLCISKMTGAHITDVLILTAPYTSLHLRNVARSLVKERDLDEELIALFEHMIDEFAESSKIRNYIAHSRWTQGKHKAKIRPTGVDIRQGRLVLSDRVKTPEYSLKDLQNQEKKLQDLCSLIIVWMLESGALTEEAIAKIKDGIEP